MNMYYQISGLGHLANQVWPVSELANPKLPPFENLLPPLSKAPAEQFKVHPEFLLHKRNKLSDFISSSHLSARHMFICSINACELIAASKTSKYQRFVCTVKYKETAHEYAILFFYEVLYDVIDFQRSAFYIQKPYTYANNPDRARTPVAIDSYENYEAYKEKDIDIGVKKLYFINNLSYDFFRIDVPSFSGVYISESLKNLFEQNNISGYTLSGLDETGELSKSIRY